MSFLHPSPSKEPILQIRHIQIGALLLLALFPGCVLPVILSLAGLLPNDAPFYTALTTGALGVCVLLALRGPWWTCAAGGVLTMAGALLVRLPALVVRPDSLLLYEMAGYVLTPLLLLGSARFWKWLTGRQGPAYLLTVITLLMIRVGWGLGEYLIINKLYFGSYNILSVLPSPLQLLWLLALYCGVYLLFSLALFSEASDKPKKASAAQEGSLTDPSV